MIMSKVGRPSGYVVTDATKALISAAQKGNRNKLRKAVSVDDNKYSSITEAAEQLKIAKSTVYNRLKSTNTMWENWFYL